MKKFITITLTLFIILPVVLVDIQSQEVPTFTDQDLEKYKPYYEKTEPPEKIKPEIDDPCFKNRSLNINKETKPKRHEVSYTTYEGTANRIIISVTVNDTVTVPMILDTGAPGMHISYTLAEKLGILDNDEGRLFTIVGGLGGEVPAIITIIDKAQVEGAKDHFIPATVSRSEVFRNFEGLIGMDFLANYDIQLDTKRHVVVFEERPPRPNTPGGHDEDWWRNNFHDFASLKEKWEEYREYLYNLEGDPKKLKSFKEFADKQCKEAEKLLNRLNSYAIDHAVPMEWREY